MDKQIQLPGRVCMSIFLVNSDCDKNNILEYYLKVLKRNFQVMSLNSDEISENISFNLMKNHFDPLTGLIWEPRLDDFKCVVSINSFQDGWVGFMEGLSDHFKFTLLHVSFAKLNSDYEPYSKFIFHNASFTRIIYAISDRGKWDFFQKGELQNFENQEYYSRKKIKNRLNSEILVNYLQNIGVDIMKKSFWHSDKSGYYFQALTSQTFLEKDFLK